ncbi:MAG: aminopeptidase P family protein [Bacteroidetes bacterium]|nr:aminopeptidase P family protein [Bacteroidota bacterium]MDA0874232.1 aminopeptidase P family protein [Bacteroidota bacterium]
MHDRIRSRIAGVRERLDPGAETALLVANGPDMTWCSGFSGSNGCLVFLSDRTVLITDGRYETQAAEECPGLEVVILQGDALRSAAVWLSERPIATVLVQADHVPWATLRHVEHVLPRAEIQPVNDPFPDLRAPKSSAEVGLIRRALEITEATFTRIIGTLKEGITENELAAEIDHLQRREGASRSAYDTIVAFSERSALPHARPGGRALKHGDIILLDFGCVVEGYHSDMTRMIAFGGADKSFLDAYAAVQDALQKATDHASAGIQGVVLDAVARDVLTRHGVGNRFTHSLGHGVGLEIHEYPSVSAKNPHPLPAGSVITLEPGVYFPGSFGIRIENMVQLRSDGCDVFNSLDTRLTLV